MPGRQTNRRQVTKTSNETQHSNGLGINIGLLLAEAREEMPAAGRFAITEEVLELVRAAVHHLMDEGHLEQVVRNEIDTATYQIGRLAGLPRDLLRPRLLGEINHDAPGVVVFPGREAQLHGVLAHDARRGLAEQFLDVLLTLIAHQVVHGVEEHPRPDLDVPPQAVPVDPHLSVRPHQGPRPAVGEGVQLPPDVCEHGARPEFCGAVLVRRGLIPEAAGHGLGICYGRLEDELEYFRELVVLLGRLSAERPWRRRTAPSQRGIGSLSRKTRLKSSSEWSFCHWTGIASQGQTAQGPVA